MVVAPAVFTQKPGKKCAKNSMGNLPNSIENVLSL
jgi:hypothetical protein